MWKIALFFRTKNCNFLFDTKIRENVVQKSLWIWVIYLTWQKIPGSENNLARKKLCLIICPSQWTLLMHDGCPVIMRIAGKIKSYFDFNIINWVIGCPNWWALFKLTLSECWSHLYNQKKQCSVKMACENNSRFHCQIRIRLPGKGFKHSIFLFAGKTTSWRKSRSDCHIRDWHDWSQDEWKLISPCDL